jgi:glucose-6-phosphate 1-epimerase
LAERAASTAGFARNLVWKVSNDMSKDKENPSVTMELVENEETMAMWPNKFKAVYRVGLDEDRLDCELTVTNTDDKAWDFQAALHTYFATSDIDKAEVRGRSSTRCRTRPPRPRRPAR